MTKPKFKPKERALVIVAHPDDETIWMGGFILKHPEMNWTIFSLCRASDADRAPKFFKVCEFFKAKGIMADLDDEGRLSLKQTLPLIESLIKKNIKSKDWDYVFTHGANGEYGHPRHIGIHKIVKKMAENKELKAKNFFYFNYKKISYKQFSPLGAKTDSDWLLKLTKQDFAKKKKIMTDIYGFAPDGIDTNYCANPEAFRK